MCMLKVARILLLFMGACQVSMFNPHDLESYIMCFLIIGVIVSVQIGLEDKRALKRRVQMMQK